MVQYRRSRVAGGIFFFTVNLRDRRLTLLVEHAKVLRDIVRGVRTELPFVIDAMVVLPEHWHAVWTLPPNDAGYARRIKHGHVARAIEWPHSTLHRYVKHGLLAADWASHLTGRRVW